MRFGISTELCTPDNRFEDIARRIKDSGYDCIDFNLCDYSNEDSPLQGKDWIDWVTMIRDVFERVGLVISQAHAMFGVFAPLDFNFQSPEDILLRNIEACKLLGCSELVFHPVLYHDVLDSDIKRSSLMEYNVKWFQSLLPLANECNVNISIENLYDRRKQEKPPVFTNVESILELIHEINGEMVGICFDIGHAHIMNHDIGQQIKRCGQNLRTLHVHDNLGSIEPITPDTHLFPGSGSVDFLSMFQALRKCNYQGIVSLEPSEDFAKLPLPIYSAMMKGGLLVTKAYAQNAGSMHC